MQNSNKLVIGVILALAIIGSYYFPAQKFVASAPSTVGTTNASPRISQVVANTTASTTWATFLNSDSSDRLISTVDYNMASTTNTGNSCTVNNNGAAGTGSVVSSFILQAATSSEQYDLNSSVTYVLNTQVATTSWQFIASTTPGLTTTSNLRLWPAGSYLNFVANGTTTTACNVTIRVGYLAL